MNDDLIRETIQKFRWYHPIEFGNGIVASNYVGKHSIESYEFGLKKWRYIVERNLPDVQGMRVLDLGCNTGLYCIQLARMGAREVIGIDSERTWPWWREQALFVKEALEWRCRAKYNIEFIDAEMTNISQLDLGRFDLVLGLCCIYYLSKAEIHSLLSFLRETGTPKIILQGNSNRRDQSKETHQKALPSFLSNALRKAQYPHVYIDAPLFYSRPIIVGSREPTEWLPQSKRDRVRDWIRRLV